MVITSTDFIKKIIDLNIKEDIVYLSHNVIDQLLPKDEANIDINIFKDLYFFISQDSVGLAKVVFETEADKTKLRTNEEGHPIYFTNFSSFVRKVAN